MNQTPNEDSCCERNGVRVVRSTCMPGEVVFPVARCSEQPDAGMPDTGTMCNDGRFDPGLEECDMNMGCGATLTCIDCSCVNLCGNDMLDQGESCEVNTDCNMMDQICRRCNCVPENIPAFFDDPDSDVAVMNRFYLEILEIEMLTPNANRPGTFSVRFGALPTLGDDLRACYVHIEGGNEVATLCFERSGMADMVKLNIATMNERVVDQNELPRMFNGMTLELTVMNSIGITFDPEDEFYWFTEFNGMMADRVPDQGNLPMSDIVGR